MQDIEKTVNNWLAKLILWSDIINPNNVQKIGKTRWVFGRITKFFGDGIKEMKKDLDNKRKNS